MKIAWFAPVLLILVILAGTLLVAQSNPVPLIYQPLLPASVKPGHAAFVLSVHGTGFVPGALVHWNGKALKTRFISSSTLRAQIPAAAVARPNTGSVTVTNPGGIASNVIYLPVRQPSSTVATTVDAIGLGGGEVNGAILTMTAGPTFPSPLTTKTSPCFSIRVKETSILFPARRYSKTLNQTWLLTSTTTEILTSRSRDPTAA